jgi:hypothetical protein
MTITFIILLCALPILLFLNWTKKFRDKYPETFGYILSLVGTFVGIVLGLYFTDIQEFQGKKQATIRVLETSKEELEWLVKRCDIMTKSFDTLPNKKRDKFLQLEIPPFFSETIRSQIIAEMLQPSSIEQFYIIKENLIFDSKMIQLDYKMKDLKNIKLDVEDYKKQIFSAIHTIDIEIKLLGDTIEREEFDSISKRKLALLMEQ